MKRYYLNNMTDKELTINLSTNRVIKPLSSLPLNDKDVEIFKALKLARHGIKSQLDDLVFSTIPIEQDSRYIQAMEANTGNEEVDNFLNGKSDKLPDGTTEITEEEALRLQKEADEKAAAEQKAKEELEAKAKADAEAAAKEEQEKADAALKEKLRKEIIKQAKKEKKDFAEGDLEREVEEAFAKAKAEQTEGQE